MEECSAWTPEISKSNLALFLPTRKRECIAPKDPPTSQAEVPKVNTPFSSKSKMLEMEGRDEPVQVWIACDVRGMGRRWFFSSHF
jgi:hypothetical protein